MRATLPTVRNPVMRLPSAAAVHDMPVWARVALADFLSDISTDARAQAEKAWRKHKGPMAAYWRAVAVYARHIRLAVKGARTCPPHELAAIRARDAAEVPPLLYEPEKDRRKLLKYVDAMRAALEFYAAGLNYCSRDGLVVPDRRPRVMQDGGEVARKALGGGE